MRKKILAATSIAILAGASVSLKSFARVELLIPITYDGGFSDIDKLNQLGEIYYKESDIPNLSRSNTLLGSLNKISDVTNTSSRTVYKSNWASWQEAISENYTTDIDQIYAFEKYVDMPIEVLSNERLEAHESKSYTFSEKYEYECSIKKTISSSHSSSEAASISSEIASGILIDGMNISGKLSSTYSVENSSSNSFQVTYANGKKLTMQKDYTERYTNNSNNYCYVKRCIRSKFKVYLAYEYTNIYSCEHYGSGFLWADDNWKYTYKYTKCTSAQFVFVPQNDPYYSISYYQDDYSGKTVYVGETNNNIVML